MSERTVEDELRVAQELLYLVLEQIGEPVELTSERLRNGISKDRMIDLELDNQRDVWVLRVVEISDAVE